MQPVLRHRFLLASLLTGALLTIPASASVEDDITAMKQALQEQSDLIKQQRSMLDSQARELKQQRTEMQALTPQYVRKEAKAKRKAKDKTPVDAAPVIVQSTVPPQQMQRNTWADSNQAGQPAPAQENARPEINALPDVGGVLTPKGVVMFENSTDYTNTTRNVFTFNGVQVAEVVLVGVVNAQSSRRQVVQNSARLRLGLTNRAEMDVRAPYVYRTDSLSNTNSTTGVTTRTIIDGHGLGDIDVGMSYQLNRGQNNWPFFVANVRYKHDNADGPFDVAYDSANVIQELPPGTGFKSVDASVTAIKLSDPAVFFANIGYVLNIAEDIGRNFGTTRITEVDPGDAVNASVGMGFSINPDTSFTLGYKHSHVFSTLQKSQNLGTGAFTDTRTDTAEVGAFTTGLSYRISDSTSLNLNVEVGATSDAPDVRVGFRIPIKLGKIF